MGDRLNLSFLNGTGVYLYLVSGFSFLVTQFGFVIAGLNQFKYFLCFSHFLAKVKHN